MVNLPSISRCFFFFFLFFHFQPSSSLLFSFVLLLSLFFFVTLCFPFLTLCFLSPPSVFLPLSLFPSFPKGVYKNYKSFGTTPNGKRGSLFSGCQRQRTRQGLPVGLYFIFASKIRRYKPTASSLLYSN